MQRRRRKDRLTKVVKRAQQIIGMQDTNSSEDKKSCTKRTWLHLFSNCDDAPKKVIHKHDLPMKGGKKNSSIRLLQFLDLELSLSVCPANISGTGKPVPLIWKSLQIQQHLNLTAHHSSCQKMCSNVWFSRQKLTVVPPPRHNGSNCCDFTSLSVQQMLRLTLHSNCSEVDVQFAQFWPTANLRNWPFLQLFVPDTLPVQRPLWKSCKKWKRRLGLIQGLCCSALALRKYEMWWTW